MKRLFQAVTIFIFTCLASSNLFAQKGVKLSLNYNVATPVGSDFKDYINVTSTRGAQGSLMYGFNNNIKAGLQVSFSNFYKKYNRQVYTTGDGTKVSAVLNNTLQTIPLIAKGEYAFLKSGFIRPFAGVGAGVNFINFQQYVGASSYNRNYTTAAYTGDVGFVITPFKTPDFGLRLSTSYFLVPFNKEEINNLNSWNAQAGITITLK